MMIFNQCKRPSDSWLTTALKNNTVKYCLVKVGSSFLSILRSVYLCYFFSPYMSTYCHILHSLQGTEVRFLVSFSVNFLLWQYVINPPEKKLANRTSVHCSKMDLSTIFSFILPKLATELTKIGHI